jgi:hypothetical protein
MKRLAGAVLFLTLAAPAFGQSMDFQQLFSGKEFPHTLKLAELDGDWRRVSIGIAGAQKGGLSDMLGPLMQAGMMSDGDKGKGKNDAAAAMLGMSFFSSLFGGGEKKEPVYYTKGKTVTVGSETFLLAYCFEKPELNLMQLAADSEKNGKDPDFSKAAMDGRLTPESALTISLLNVKSITTLNSIRPFDMAQEIADSAKGGGGLMDLIAQEQAKDQAKETKSPAKPVAATSTPKKPAARP